MFTFFRSIWSSPSSMSSAPSSSHLSQWLPLLLRQVWSLLDLCRLSHSILLGIGCAIIFTGVPVYFIIVSDDYVKKPESVRRFLGEEDLEKPSVHFHPFSYDALFPFSFNLCAAAGPFNLPKPCSVWNNLAAKVVPGRCHRQNRLKPSRSPWLYLYQGLTDPRPVVKRGIIDVFLRHRDSGSSESSCCSSQRWLNAKINNSGCDKR